MAFTTTPILVHPNFAKAFYLETDASDFALGTVLSQIGVDRKLHPVAFYPRKFSATEINYEIHDKELLAIVDTFQEWRYFLKGVAHPVIEYTDHKNLDGSNFESSSSSMEHVAISIWDCYQLQTWV